MKPYEYAPRAGDIMRLHDMITGKTVSYVIVKKEYPDFELMSVNSNEHLQMTHIRYVSETDKLNIKNEQTNP